MSYMTTFATFVYCLTVVLISESEGQHNKFQK